MNVRVNYTGVETLYSYGIRSWRASLVSSYIQGFGFVAKVIYVFAGLVPYSLAIESGQMGRGIDGIS